MTTTALIAISAAFASGAQAQQATAGQDASGASTTTTAPTSSAATTLPEIVVTGQRAALKSAINIKKSADVILDSISADDAGKLPDNSVTEVLQRIVGVNMTRIQTGAVGAENFLAEGTGIEIRGLDSVVSELNGRDSFSSANGRTLAWEDIPPELMQGVDVYKSAEANLPEGGLGGTINLRTRQPFDYKGLTVSGAVEGNYADYADSANASANLMVSDRWQTPVGEFGLLANLAYSDLKTKADGVQVQPYFPEVYDPSLTSADLATGGGTRLPYLGDPSASQVYVTDGIDFTQRLDDRKREGVYVAAQYKPNDDLTVGLTYFHSQYQLDSLTYSMTLGSTDSFLPPGSVDTFNKQGFLTSTNDLAGYGYSAPGSAAAGSTGGGVSGSTGYMNNPYTFNSGVSTGVNQTTDYSFSGEWRPDDRLDVKFALQHVDSSANETDHNAVDYAFLPQVGLALSSFGSATLPKLTFPATIDLTNAANYGYLATMDHLDNNQGQENAIYVDSTYKLSDTGFIRALGFGLKITQRTENDDQTPYNYQGVSPYYGSAPYTYLAGSSNSVAAYNALVNLGSWFGGQMGLPKEAWFPSLTELNTSFSTLHQQLGSGVNTAQTSVSFVPADLSHVDEDTTTTYLMAIFRSDDNPIVPYRGNIGLRIVDSSDSASGNLLYPMSLGTEYTPVESYVAPTYAASSVNFVNPQYNVPIHGGHAEVDVLPSVNIQFLPTQQLHIRFAASEGLDRPSFQQLNPQGNLGGTYVGTYTQNFITSILGNPNLRPETALQLDASIEYYFRDGGQIHAAVFYKQLHNYIGTETTHANYTLPTSVASGSFLPSAADQTQYNSALTPCAQPVTVGEYCPQTITAVVQQYFNEPATATIAGVEVGLQKYADFLPKPFNGFGIDANYTYIDSHQPGAVAYDILGDKINGLPVTGLSKNTVNISGMYDSGPISARLAYSWRDDFLVTTSAYQTSGAYDNETNVPDTTNGTDVNQYGVPTYYAFPVFQYPSGQLDGSFSYRLNSKLTWVMQASNLTNTVTRLYMGWGDQKVNRSWYMADRRYTMALRFQF